MSQDVALSHISNLAVMADGERRHWSEFRRVMMLRFGPASTFSTRVSSFNAVVGNTQILQRNLLRRGFTIFVDANAFTDLAYIAFSEKPMASTADASWVVTLNQGFSSFQSLPDYQGPVQLFWATATGSRALVSEFS